MKYVTISLAAEMRGVSLRAAQNAVADGRLPIAVQIEGLNGKITVGVTRESVDRWEIREPNKKKKSKRLIGRS